jgi:hypothetical protein
MKSASVLLVATLAGGAVLDDRKEDRDLGKFCKSTVSYPVLSGTQSPAAERALNAALAAAARVDAARCHGSSEMYPYGFETTYRVEDSSRPGLLELYFERYENLAGAHGFTSARCYVADLDRGTLTPLTVTLLAPAARTALEKLTRQALAGSRDSLFDVDTLAVTDDTTLCAEHDGLRVTFPAGIASPWMDGRVSATLPPADVRPLAAGTALEAFLR